MAELQTTLHDIAAAIVDSPDEVKVVREEDDDTITLTLTVAPDDMGMVIGRHGRIAKAIRTVIKAASADCGKRVNVEIRDCSHSRKENRPTTPNQVRGSVLFSVYLPMILSERASTSPRYLRRRAFRIPL